MKYLAHISEDGKREQTVKEHLEGTAKLAGDFADAFGCRGWGYGCGLMHDIGKYSEAFQKRLHGGSRTDHATAGAKELFHRKNLMGAYCVSGHHTGLLDGTVTEESDGKSTLLERMEKSLEDYHAYEEEISVPNFPGLPLKQLGKGGFSLSFFIRMLFSCLVDADYLDTERFMSEGMARPVGNTRKEDLMEVLWNRLLDYVEDKGWLKETDPATVNGRRSAILKACMERGDEGQGIYQLTVPTGGGKTVSSLAFALRHARRHRLSRVIYVIPYTSIIEQNAQIFKDILGEDCVLEDHSNTSYEDGEELRREQMAAENWDRPVVATTNVQFFESFYSNRTSKCRKLHHVAGSVLIFDEAQMLPVGYLKPCIQAISELVFNYRCTAVICTATQPSLRQFFPERLAMEELCPDVQGQYGFFKRTDVRNIGTISEDGLVERLHSESQALCILNSRKRVQRVYERLEGEGIYHLSTWMYPKHRKRRLKEVRDRLAEGLPCRLIATSLVEAGVDLDFQSVYRELAGIDSIVQAAGRCNREGKRDRVGCGTYVFKMEEGDGIRIPRELGRPAAVAEQVSKNHPDVSSLEAVREYFDRLYHYEGDGVDRKGILDYFEEESRSRLFPFATVAGKFRMIEDHTRAILIDLEPEAADIVQRIRKGESSRQLVRDAGHYCVNVSQGDYGRLNGAGLLEALALDFYRLRDSGRYTEEEGLVMDMERGDAMFF